jgi:hypothetical protein
MVLACRSRAGLAMSQDGKNWARLEAEHHTAAVLDAGDEGDWDASFIASPQVLKRCSIRESIAAWLLAESMRS